MVSKRSIWTAGLITAAAASAAFGVGVYVGGGLAAYGETEIRTREGYLDGDMGTSWAVGGGIAIPVWWGAGPVTPTVELATDLNFTMVDKEFEEPYLFHRGAKITAVPIRETVVLGVGVGPAAVVKPYAGFGVGATVVKWKAYYTVRWLEPIWVQDVKIDSGTDVKATFSVPFGCDFRLTPNFSIGPRAEYLIITGKVEGYDPYEPELFDSTVPNIFLFGATARFDL